MIKVDFIPVKLRLPLKFGTETIDSLKAVHVELAAYGATGRGETPLSAAWAWPGKESFSFRQSFQQFLIQIRIDYLHNKMFSAEFKWQ